jgi:hypothetical protein
MSVDAAARRISRAAYWTTVETQTGKVDRKVGLFTHHSDVFALLFERRLQGIGTRVSVE